MQSLNELPPFQGNQDKLLRINGVNLRVRWTGPSTAPAVILAHGFPEFWYGWRHQIIPLVAAGWRVVLYDQRGYATSSKPHDPAMYTPEKLVGDAVGVMDALDLPSAVFVGHDWGGTVGYHLAARHPDRVSKLVVLNAAHPAAMPLPPAPVNPAPYRFMLNVPVVPEHLIARLGTMQFRNLFAKNVRKGAFSEEDLALYREEWSREDGLRAMFAWWQAAQGAAPARISVPTLLLWGDKDPFLSQDLAAKSIAGCEQGTLKRFAAAGHFLHHDAPEEVAAAIVDFIGRHELIHERTRPIRW